MRGGVAKWKRGARAAGSRHAVAYAFQAQCDASLGGVEASAALRAAAYAGASRTRYTATLSGLTADELTPDQLQAWFEGNDPLSGERRGVELDSPEAVQVLDATLNAPKTFSLAALLDPEIQAAYEALQDRLRDRVIELWRAELNARRGHAGARREALAQLEVVELRHERSRALDPHKHRHLWLNTRVLGRDGKWSAVDAQTMMRFQTVINSEGELAARTDPEWRAALAAKGYTLDANGEIEQLTKVVRPLSKRANQIEANKAVRLAEWRDQHPGQEPGPDVLAAVDRWAWAHGRPGKPALIDEADWADAVRREIADIDPAAVRTRTVVPVAPVHVGAIDRDELAHIAIAEADARAAARGGRFSVFDVRAGAGRAVAASGLVADRSLLSELIEDVTTRALADAVRLVDDGAAVPGHVRSLMWSQTARAKAHLAELFDGLHQPGLAQDADTVAHTAAAVLGEGRALDAGQAAAAGAIAGTDRMVTVTGPAGTGKTTMLRVARALLEESGRRMRVVAPTKKAASVAGRETGASASSLHALLHDHGFRWEETSSGQRWSRLLPGEVDPVTGTVWDGPRNPLQQGERVVVDEAGMVDLHTAIALAQLTTESGAALAMVGDHLQALPVGHSGAMSLARTRSSAVVELSAVHRFHDKEWARLSLRLRDPGTDAEAIEVATQIVGRGNAATVTDDIAARAHMVEAYFTARRAGESVSLVTATHAEAQAINEAIQARLIATGVLKTRHAFSLQDGQAAYCGDVVQTRRNDSAAGVENRQVWRISHQASDGSIVLASVTDAGVTRSVSEDYLSRHTHLAYAATVHGVQGETTDRSIVGPGVDAAGLYVGLTRGRRHNQAVVVAATAEGAVDELAQTMRRGSMEASLEDAVAAAGRDLSRAARDVAGDTSTETVPDWDNRQARPFGHLMKLEDTLAATRERRDAARATAETLAETVSAHERTLRTLRMKVTWAAAHAHLTLEAGRGPVEALHAVTARVGEARDRQAEAVAEYRKVARTARRMEQETVLRDGLSQPQRAAEDESRRASAVRTLRQRTRGTSTSESTGPVTGPAGRGLGRDSGPSLG